VTLFDAELGRTALEAALTTGTFDRLLALPDAALTILADTRDPGATLAWADLAGVELAAVADLGLHRLAAPADFTSDALAALLVQDESVEQAILALTPDKRAALLALPTGLLNDLARLESAADLDWLAGYLAASERPQVTVAQEVVDGAVTVQDLRAPQLVTATAAPLPTVEPPAGTAAAADELQQPLDGGSILNPNLLLLLLLLAGGAGVLVALRRRR
jgi:hypothetical protein